MTDIPTVKCPSCGAASHGKFCSLCGARLGPVMCSACGGTLASGSRYCAHCGVVVGSTSEIPVRRTWNSSISMRDLTSWQLVGLLGAIAAIALLWAFTAPSGKPGAPAPGAATAASVVPDISNLSPREQFGRLADKVEAAMESGDTATVVRFFPMAEQAWNSLAAADRDLDARLHVGLLRARIGHAPAALAQADTIAAAASSHLFADYLRAIIGDFQSDSIAARRARESFREHFASEIALNRPEYQAHRQMLDQFFATIPRKRGAK